MTPYKIEAGSAQHVGHQAQQNDRVALLTGARAPGFMLAVLAGGVAGGASAAEQVLHTARQMFDAFKPGPHPGVDVLTALLHDVVHEADLVIRLNSVASGSEAHCSLTALLITPTGLAVWAHVGDARLYHFHAAACLLRTSDAGYIDALMENDMTLDAARKHRRSPLLLNVLGNRHKTPFVAIGSHAQLAAGDAFLLCSAGLWHYFTDAELAAVLRKNTPRQASGLLIDKARERAHGKGGNCTMAIVKLVEVPAPVTDYSVKMTGRTA
ncbi:MAG: serine/threonine-protein phosphatase [Massilia sp.]|nr:serine/threonine-protein phosphatase [Massilia sp.]